MSDPRKPHGDGKEPGSPFQPNERRSGHQNSLSQSSSNGSGISPNTSPARQQQRPGGESSRTGTHGDYSHLQKGETKEERRARLQRLMDQGGPGGSSAWSPDSSALGSPVDSMFGSSVHGSHHGSRQSSVAGGRGGLPLSPEVLRRPSGSLPRTFSNLSLNRGDHAGPSAGPSTVLEEESSSSEPDSESDDEESRRRRRERKGKGPANHDAQRR